MCHGNLNPTTRHFRDSLRITKFFQPCAPLNTQSLTSQTISGLDQENCGQSLEIAIMSLTNCRFYEEKYPEVESFVMVNVKQVRTIRLTFSRCDRSMI